MDKPTKKRGRPAKRARKSPVKREPAKKIPIAISGHPEDYVPDHKQHAAWQLRKLGYTIAQTAQILSISATTVVVYDQAVNKYFEDLPAVRTATDAITAMIPKALEVYERGLKSYDPRVARDTAKDILISTKALRDRQTVETIDDSSKSDVDLVAEAERVILIAGSKTAAGSDNG